MALQPPLLRLYPLQEQQILPIKAATSRCSMARSWGLPFSPALDDRALPVILLDHVARYLGLNLRIDKSIQRGNPVTVERHVAPFDCRDGHRHWGNNLRCALLFRARR